MKLNKIFSKDEFKNIEKELETLGKSGKLTPDTIKSYEDFNKELSKSGITAEQIVEKFNKGSESISILSEEGFKKFTDEAQRASGIFNEIFDNIEIENPFKDLSGEDLKKYVDEQFDGVSDEVKDKILDIIKQYKAGKIDIDDAKRQLELSFGGTLLNATILESNTALKEVFSDNTDVVDGMIDSYKELSATFDNVGQAMANLKTAQEEMNESGKLSAKTVIDLMGQNENYANVLEVVDGNVRLVDGAEKILTEAKIDAIRKSAALAVEEAELALANAKAGKSSSTLSKSLAGAGGLTFAQKAVASTTAFLQALLGGQGLAGAMEAANTATKQMTTNFEAAADSNSIEELESNLANAKKRLDIANALKPSDLSKSYAPSKKSSTKKGSTKEDKTDYWKEEFEKQYKALQHQLKMNEISEVQYTDRVESLYKKYFSDRSKYLDDYNKYEEEVYSNRKKIFDDEIKYIEHTIDLVAKRNGTEQQQVSMFKQLQDKIQAQMNYYYSIGLSANHEYITSLQDQWQQYQDKIQTITENIYETAIKVATRALDKEIKALNERNEALQKEKEILEDNKSKWETTIDYSVGVIDDQIKALNEQKEALQKANDEQDRAIELEKLQQALLNAKTQKNVRVYYEDLGFVWETNKEAIDEAQKSLDDFNAESQIKEIEDQIESWEKEKELWTSVVENYEKGQDKLTAEEQLGYDLAKKILEKKSSGLVDYISKEYENVNEQIKNKDKEIESNQEKINSLEELKEEWNSVSSNYEENQEKINNSLIFGANFEKEVLNGRLEFLKDFVNKYNTEMDKIQQKTESFVTQKPQTPTGGGAGGGGGANTPAEEYKPKVSTISSTLKYGSKGDNVKTLQEALNAVVNAGLNIDGVFGSKTRTAVKQFQKASSISADGVVGKSTKSAFGNRGYAQGTFSAEGGLSMVGEEGAELRVLNKGDGIIPSNVTKNLMGWGKISPINYLSSLNSLKPMQRNLQENGNIVLHIANITLPNVKDSQEFLKDLKQYAITHKKGD